MRFKRSTKSASEIGQELAVDYLLEGSVRREGNRVRITAQLIESRTETHLWAETYDRRLEESLLLQSDVAARIAQSLAMELVPDHRDALVRVEPAADRGVSGVPQRPLSLEPHRRRRVDVSALTYYERALELDPGFAAAYAAMARGQVAMADFSREPGRDAFARARDGGAPLPGTGPWRCRCARGAGRSAQGAGLELGGRRSHLSRRSRAVSELRHGPQLLFEISRRHVAARGGAARRSIGRPVSIRCAWPSARPPRG